MCLRMLAHEWIIIILQRRVIYFWYLECKIAYAVYYIDFTLLFALINQFKKKFVFHCWMLNDIFDDTGTVNNWNKQLILIVEISFTWKSQYFTSIYVINVYNIRYPILFYWGPSLLWSYGSWIYNYLWNQCLSSLKLRVLTPFLAMCSRYNIIW